MPMRARLFLLLLVLLPVLSASAQPRRWERDGARRDRWRPARSVSEGFFVEGGLLATRLRVDPDRLAPETDAGGGLHLRAGYGFTRRVALYGALSAAGMNGRDDTEYGLAHLDLGVQLTFARPAAPLVPYVNLALGGVAATFDAPLDVVGIDGDVTYSGGAVTAGGGVRYHVTRGLAMGVGLEGYAGQFTRVAYDGSVDIEDEIDDLELSGTRLRVGLVWFPGSRRR